MHYIPYDNAIARIRVIFRSAVILLFASAVLALSALPPGDQLERVRFYTRTLEFDYVSWIADGLWLKWSTAVFGGDRYLDKKTEHGLVLEYLDLVRQQTDTLSRVTRVYSDPDISDPKTASAVLRQELAGITARMDKIRPFAESILQKQVSQVVTDLGLSVGGQPIPPVMYHTTELPLALIISPRSVIQQDANISLLAGMNIDQIVALEDQVSKDLDVSTLITEVGGIGVYPTMITRTDNLDWLSEVIAHEWIHNYLTLRPLGMSIGNNDQLRAMNETTANIAGKEIGRAVIANYYPELLPKPAADEKPAPPPSATTEQAPPAFNFNREMHTIRVHADQLLAEGKIEEAEKYMEDSRRIFLENGYIIRKLNQAYFAFHGAYADDPVGAAGEDPIGPAIRKLREQSLSLADFLHRVSTMTTFAELQTAVQ